MALTAKHVAHPKPGKHHDGRGLYLIVTDNSLRWQFRGTINGKRREWGLGHAGKLGVGLAEAREKAEEYRALIRDGIDPAEDRKRVQAEALAVDEAQALVDSIPTFQEATMMVHKEHAPTFKNHKDAARWLSSMERLVFPTLGGVSVDKVTAPMVRDMLAGIWLEKPHTAKKVKQRICIVLDFAHIQGWREQEAPMRSITKALPKQKKKANHYAAMKWQDLPAFIADIDVILKTHNVIRRGIEFTILTASRSGEVRLATWDEIDLNTATWTRPEEHMKAGLEHRVPLSNRAIELLGEPGTGVIFPGVNLGRPISNMAFTMPLRRAGLGIVMHGFRSTFRDWCGEATNTPREVAEAALAHGIKDQTEAAYARSDLFEKRRVLMDKWSDYCCSTNNVTALRAV